MQARMDNPAMTVPGAFEALLAFGQSAHHAGLPETTIALVHLRSSQINGCAVCVDMHAKDLAKAGEPAEKIYAVSAWRDAPYFDDAERAALALAETVTRIDQGDEAVPDPVWDEAARHYDEPALAALLVAISAVNVWNRLNASTRQVAGSVPV
jgi:AhpD family alkylhydroperoxidase